MHGRYLVSRSTYMADLEPVLIPLAKDDCSCEWNSPGSGQFCKSDGGICPKSVSEEDWKRVVYDDGTLWKQVREFLNEHGRLGHKFKRDKNTRPGSSKWLED